MSPPPLRPGGVVVRVPATSANLGPGFDSLGLALGLHDELTVHAMPGGLSVDVVGEGADDLARDENHLVVQALRTGFRAAGLSPADPLPGLAVRCRNAIPHGRGLGSSAAATVAGLIAARGMLVDGEAQLPDGRVLGLAAGMEGHPDNAAACLLGGLTVAVTSDEGPRAVRCALVADLRAVIVIPAARLPTALARAVLPTTVPHADAAANAARAGLLVAALTGALLLGDRPLDDLLLEATADRLHQGYRASAMPSTLALMGRLREAGLAAVVSGAGPGVLVLGSSPALAEQVAAHLPPEGRWQLRALPVDDGAICRPLP